MRDPDEEVLVKDLNCLASEDSINDSVPEWEVPLICRAAWNHAKTITVGQIWMRVCHEEFYSRPDGKFLILDKPKIKFVNKFVNKFVFLYVDIFINGAKETISGISSRDWFKIYERLA